MISNFLFDLDGTLTDPGTGITNSVKYALEALGIVPGSRKELEKFIGPPLADSFMEYYKMSSAQAANAIDKYREYFSVTGIFENELYAGIPDLLENIKSKGNKIYLATSKPTLFAEKILAHFKLDTYFSGVVGSPMNHKGSEKNAIISEVMATYSIAAETAVMVGDRKYDITGAKANGMISIGVLFGYGGRAELEQAGADYLAPTVQKLAEIISSI